MVFKTASEISPAHNTVMNPVNRIDISMPLYDSEQVQKTKDIDEEIVLSMMKQFIPPEWQPDQIEFKMVAPQKDTEYQEGEFEN